MNEPKYTNYLVSYDVMHLCFRASLIVSILILFLATMLFGSSSAQGLHDLSSNLPKIQSKNHSEDVCNFGAEAWSTVKKHHDARLKYLEKKTRRLSMEHPNSIEAKIALAKEYRALGNALLNVTQYDKATLAFQNATVLLKDIPEEKSLYNDSVQEMKACCEKKNQRAVFLSKLKLRKTVPSSP